MVNPDISLPLLTAKNNSNSTQYSQIIYGIFVLLLAFFIYNIIHIKQDKKECTKFIEKINTLHGLVHIFILCTYLVSVIIIATLILTIDNKENLGNFIHTTIVTVYCSFLKLLQSSSVTYIILCIIIIVTILIMLSDIINPCSVLDCLDSDVSDDDSVTVSDDDSVVSDDDSAVLSDDTIISDDDDAPVVDSLGYFFAIHNVASADDPSFQPNLIHFSQFGVSTDEILRSQLITDLGALGKEVIFIMKDIDKRIGNDENRNSITFADVYDTDPKYYQLSDWSISLRLIDDSITQLDKNKGEIIGSKGIEGWQWEFNKPLIQDGIITNDGINNGGLTITSPSIDLTYATFGELPSSTNANLVSWTIGERLDFLSRSNFYMLFEHNFYLNYSKDGQSSTLNFKQRSIKPASINGSVSVMNVNIDDDHGNFFD